MEHTRIWVVESSDEVDRRALEIGLEVDGPFGEDGGSENADFVDDETSAIFSQHSGVEGPIEGHVELGGSRVGVGGVHGARAKNAER